MLIHRKHTHKRLLGYKEREKEGWFGPLDVRLLPLTGPLSDQGSYTPSSLHHRVMGSQFLPSNTNNDLITTFDGSIAFYGPSVVT